MNEPIKPAAPVTSTFTGRLPWNRSPTSGCELAAGTRFPAQIDARATTFGTMCTPVVKPISFPDSGLPGRALKRMINGTEQGSPGPSLICPVRAGADCFRDVYRVQGGDDVGFRLWTGGNPGHAARQRARVRQRGDCAAGGRDRCVQRVPARALPKLGRWARTALPSGNDTANRAGVPRALHRHGGNKPRIRVRRPFLRRPLQPLRKPDSPLRHRATERPVSSEIDFRGVSRRPRT